MDRLITELIGRCFSFIFRAVHTNYDAKFTCEAIKLAVIKNHWLAQRLGGDMYSVVFRYEQGKVSSAKDQEAASQKPVSYDTGETD